MQEIRLRFSKEDRAKYISHLDINRVMSRALRRAQIPLWFTEGFNPHAYMSFSLPLSLGVESLCETVDIRLLEDMPCEEVKNRLNSVMPMGIRIMDVYSDFRDCSEIAYSDYVYKIEFQDNEEALKRIETWLNGEQIIALKKAKAGRKRVWKETDIKGFIDNYNISVRDTSVVLNIRLAAGPSRNLNPSLFFDALIRGIDMDFEWKRIQRIRLLDKDYKEFK